MAFLLDREAVTLVPGRWPDRLSYPPHRLRNRYMQLTKIRITNFRSVHDSTDIDIGSATCLVGKNESGKTAVLQALYRLNPLVATHGDFDATEDYPRRRLAQYEDDLAAERCEPATVTRATFELSADDIQAVAAVYGPDCLNPDNLTVTLRKGYTNKLHLVGPAVNADAALAHLVGTAGLEPPLQESLRVRRGVEETLALLQQADQTDSVRALISRVQPLHDRDLARCDLRASLAQANSEVPLLRSILSDERSRQPTATQGARGRR